MTTRGSLAPENLKQRLLANSRTYSPSGCRFWYGGMSSNGYGVISVGNRSTSVHVLSYRLFVGDIPAGMCVLHKCDNRNCLEPSHLFLGTRGENNSDRKRKGRNDCRVGAFNTQAKLTSNDVRKIRRLCKTQSQRSVSTMFGICQQQVSAIVRRIHWKHVE